MRKKLKPLKFGLILIVSIFLTFGATISLQSLLAAWIAPNTNPPTNNIFDFLIGGSLGVGENVGISGKVGVGTVINSTARLIMQATSSEEGLRIISSNFSPFVVRDTTNTVDLFRVKEDGGVCIGTDCITGWPSAGAASFSQWATSTTGIYHNAGSVGIGTTTPNSKLTVVGDVSIDGVVKSKSFQLADGAGPGKILTSDVDGNAIWQDPATSGSIAYTPSGMYGDCLEWQTKTAVAPTAAYCSDLWGTTTCYPASPGSPAEFGCIKYGDPFSCSVLQGCVCPVDFTKVKIGDSKDVGSYYSCLMGGIVYPPLYANKHTENDCTVFGGVVFSDLENKFCKFNSGGCPSGWVPYTLTTTSPKTCTYVNASYGTGKTCTTGSHTWTKTTTETCLYCSSANQWGCSSYSTCTADLTQRSCY